ncbi:sulfatase-like hydrolase/transferase [Prosthecobacter vanneervenii]|uniref:Arylsulfatase A-like enzyme n=1 Tax=Prosthecobacter vanneervenii TaxID=48466 RepID=A0A7W8DMQ1_9BACT|nr:sulfatase-like hydrolase/transferase [Prosthecobacter vanneervenii]MBB5035704.1 arylsulfatase A-like enzyme [Prosthecobacter vanneervenii]
MRFLLFCIILAVLPGPAKVFTKPTVVFILVDDMGWGDPSCFGGKVPTPNMDRLAAGGMQFRQFYVASPICSASRCGILTGQFPARHRITSYLQTRAGNRECEQADYLDPKAPSLPRILKEAGYATAHIGKWHLGGGRDVTDAPKFAAYGYDLGLGTYESPEPAAALGLKTTPWETKREPQQVERHDRTHWMVDETLKFVREHPDKPCFVNLWLDDVHTPYRPVEGQDDRPLPEKYREVLTETDRQIGRLMDALPANTLIILCGDNGPEPTLDHTRTNGLRGMKWSLYEGGIRTPLIIRWPGTVPAGAVNETTVFSSVDFLPTLCSLLWLRPPDADLDGECMSPAWEGKTMLRGKPLFWEYGRKPGEAGKVKGGFPYPKEPGSKSPNVAVSDGRWKLLINADGTQSELYDIHKDPAETTNLAETEIVTAQLLKKAALAWRKALP